MTTRNHYDTLGIDRSASPESVREAYRRLAREYHPDRTATSAAGGADRMAAINEAYRVLSDPGRRAMYDATLRGGAPAAVDASRGATSAAGAGDHDDEYEFRAASLREAPRMPWRTIVVAVVVAVGAVVALSQFSETDDPSPDGILRVGDCVEVEREVFAREVPCSGPGDLVVRQFIAFDRECAGGWLPLQDSQGMGVACVEPT